MSVSPSIYGDRTDESFENQVYVISYRFRSHCGTIFSQLVKETDMAESHTDKKTDRLPKREDTKPRVTLHIAPPREKAKVTVIVDRLDTKVKDKHLAALYYGNDANPFMYTAAHGNMVAMLEIDPADRIGKVDQSGAKVVPTFNLDTVPSDCTHMVATYMGIHSNRVALPEKQKPAAENWTIEVSQPRDPITANLFFLTVMTKKDGKPANHPFTVTSDNCPINVGQKQGKNPIPRKVSKFKATSPGTYQLYVAVVDDYAVVKVKLSDGVEAEAHLVK